MIVACTKCKQFKPTTELRPRPSVRRGVDSWCRECERAKSLAYHYRNKEVNNARSRAYRKQNIDSALERSRRYHKQHRARLCARKIEWRLEHEYGFGSDEKIAMLAAQHGRCAICNTDKPSGRGWCVDHNHDTRKVRQILCSPCNLAIGLLKDSPALLRAAADYIEYHSGE
jgi:hypothetical protein